MTRKITNPENGASVMIGSLTIDVGETKSFEEADANLLLSRYGFLVDANKQEAEQASKAVLEKAQKEAIKEAVKESLAEAREEEKEAKKAKVKPKKKSK